MWWAKIGPLDGGAFGDFAVKIAMFRKRPPLAKRHVPLSAPRLASGGASAAHYCQPRVSAQQKSFCESERAVVAPLRGADAAPSDGLVETPQTRPGSKL